jgi:hypothetical protein
MTNAILAHLSSNSIASALGITVTGTTPSSIPLNAYRGDTLCLRVRSIGEAARLEVNGEGCGFRSRFRAGRSTVDSPSA